jgi:S-adenosylmethionine-diacylgycerolhomoserine-N-methlytransferase
MSTQPPLERATWRDDLRVLRQFLHGRRGGDHAASLDAFYGPQAAVYDRFRERLLPGRAEFMRALDLSRGQRVADFGAGTGRHWLFVEPVLPLLAHLDLVDLCTPLLDIARKRFGGYPNVRAVRADAQAWRSDERLDAAVFSYSLSMIPDWRAALANAVRQVRPGGLIGVIDFYTLPSAAPAPLKPLSRASRFFWPRWFGYDGVMLRPDVVPTLLAMGTTLKLEQHGARLPYLPLVRAPWFCWIGRLPS